MSVLVFESNPISPSRPPSVPSSRSGWAYGYYFGFETKADADRLIATYPSGSFDTEMSDGKIWLNYRAGCNGPTPRSVEILGFDLRASDAPGNGWARWRVKIWDYDQWLERVVNGATKEEAASVFCCQYSWLESRKQEVVNCMVACS